MTHKIVHNKTFAAAEQVLDDYAEAGHKLLQISHVQVGTINNPIIHTVLTFQMDDTVAVLEGPAE